MSDLERTSSWNGLEIIEESDDVLQANASQETNTDTAPVSSSGEGGEPTEHKPVKRLTPQERRQQRQKRRKHSMIVAITVTSVVVLLLVIGGIIGFRALGEKVASDKTPEAVVEE